MRKNVIFNRGNKIKINADETLKTTSLIYLQEALENEKYEQCAELIRKAKRFGATAVEIKQVLTQYAKTIKRH